jgi:hypothetical protein
VNYNLQSALGQTGHVKINIIDGEVLINGSNLLVKGKLFKVLKYCLLGLAMPHNGTAVEGVCVTGAAIRFLVPVLSRETVPVASQYGAIFAITVCEDFITIAV